MTKKGKLCAAGLFYVLFLALIVLLCLVDRQPWAEGTEIGLATVNAWFAIAVAGLNGSWGVDGSMDLSLKLYKLTEYLGYFAILVLCVFALIGLVQLIRRRSLKKVDREILTMGGLFVLTLILYVFFEKVVVNCRPIVLPGESGFEPSFPSSHTVMAIVILGSVSMTLKKYVQNPALRAVLRVLCILLILVMVCCRFLSGCHWFTDILGGVLVSLAMLALFDAVAFGESAAGQG
jgi:undecaprenyl-diphosphatase